MPDSPQYWYDRAAAAIESDGYRDMELSTWTTWPFTGEAGIKQLERPVEAEPLRRGAGGEGCYCSAPVADWRDVLWTDDAWVLTAPTRASLPFAMFLISVRHTDLAGLTADEAARQGQLLALIERAAVEVLPVPRIQVLRWADGGEHLHWWLLARPTGALQLRGTFLAVWDDLLPLRDPVAVRADAVLVAQRLVDLAGGRVVG